MEHEHAARYPADCLLHAGDLTEYGTRAEVDEVERWLKDLPYARKVVIAGNHDLCCDPNPQNLVRLIPDSHLDGYMPEGNYRIKHCTYLNQQVTQVGEYKIWGEPRQPEFWKWAFNVRRPQMKWQVWSKVPKDIDIMITHGPPYKAGDRTPTENAGCPAQLEMISDHPTLKLVVCGHIHSGYGVYNLVKRNGQRCLVVNAALLQNDFSLREPILIEAKGDDFQRVF
jgi:predicted phosphohydrolase